MKDFRVSVWFKPILKVEWFGPNRPEDKPFNQWRIADITDTLEVDLKYENGKFVTCYLVERLTGNISAIINDEADAKILKLAVAEARKRAGEPRPFKLPMKPSKKARK